MYGIVLLSMESVPTIIPQPPAPGIYIVQGPKSFESWVLEYLSRTIVFPSKVVWVDAANAFNAYLVGITARSAGREPAAVLRSYFVARPFTAYQLETMVASKLMPSVQKVGAVFAVLADPLRLFADAEGRDTQIRQCYERFIAGLRAASRETAILVVHPKGKGVRYEKQLLAMAVRRVEVSLVGHKALIKEAA